MAQALLASLGIHWGNVVVVWDAILVVIVIMDMMRETWIAWLWWWRYYYPLKCW